MAWYTNVSVEMQPITSGYQLALAYDLYASAPTSATIDRTVENLRAMFHYWNTTEGPSIPDKLVFLLEDDYSWDDFQASPTGAIVDKYTVLTAIARECGLHLGMANLEHRIWGPEADAYWSSRNASGLRVFLEVEERYTDLDNLSDPNGRDIADRLFCSEKREMIPENWCKVIESGSDADEDSEDHGRVRPITYLWRIVSSLTFFDCRVNT